MDTRNHSRLTPHAALVGQAIVFRGQSRPLGGGSAAGRQTAGSVSVQLLIILVPVLFGLMGFAVDLGRLYLIRGELNQAANAMAMAAAKNLNGTAGSLEFAALAANNTISQELNDGNKYNFGSLEIGRAHV